ncbi:MAG: aminotransferase class I/II-fold pyridoxal phosphate-dependent enzyme [Ruminococcus sp.]
MGEFNRFDFTEVEGLDNLYHPEGIIQQSLHRIKSLYQTKESFILVNGSTVGLLTAITSVTKKGDSILAARNCHRAVYNGIELWDLSPTYLMPENVFGFCGSVDPKDVDDALERDDSITACVITSPTYEGVVSDVKEIARVCHRHDVTLILDEAHGSHFNFSDYFPCSATGCGADVVVQSTHKTLTSLTGTGLLHICTDRVDVDLVKKRLQMFQTSSPNYTMMASVDNCICDVIDRGETLFANYEKRLDNFYEKCSDLKKLQIYKGEDAFDFDRGKLIISVRGTSITGVKLQNILREDFRIETEMASSHYIVAMTSIMDTDEGFENLIDALHKIDGRVTKTEGFKALPYPYVAPKTILKAYEAEKICGEEVALENAVGRISKEYIYAYPPGIPIITPGEEFTKAVVEKITYMISMGVNVASDGDKLPFVTVCTIDTQKKMG